MAYASSEGPSLPCTVFSVWPLLITARCFGPQFQLLAPELAGELGEGCLAVRRRMLVGERKEARLTREEGDSLRFERGAVASLHGMFPDSLLLACADWLLTL
jgi:hypothetical protein